MNDLPVNSPINSAYYSLISLFMKITHITQCNRRTIIKLECVGEATNETHTVKQFTGRFEVVQILH